MAKRKHDEAHESDERWLVTYADMITLLMVFFIVMFSMANTDLKKFAAVSQSMQAAFNMINLEGGGAGTVFQNSQSISQSNGSGGSSPLLIENLPPKSRDFVRISTELTTYAQALESSGDISINMTMEGIIISLSEKLTFEPGESKLRPQVAEVLDQVVKLLEPLDNKVRVEGHTDNIATNSPMYPTNWELSVLRAVSVVQYLQNEGKIAPERLQAAGNAEYQPVGPNDTRANRALNRRVDIVIVYPGEKRQFSIDVPPASPSS